MLNEELLGELARWPLSALENAVSQLGKRPRGEGVALPGLLSSWEGPERVSGYAVTVTLSTEDDFPHGEKENIEWWRYVESRPGPKVVVAQVLDGASGQGAACGVLTAHVLRSLGCAGFVTDGYVRDVEAMRITGLKVAARGATFRHGNPHVVRFGEPVEIFGMKVSTGDLVNAGLEGAISIPAGWLAELPALSQTAVRGVAGTSCNRTGTGSKRRVSKGSRWGSTIRAAIRSTGWTRSGGKLAARAARFCGCARGCRRYGPGLERDWSTATAIRACHGPKG